MGGLKRILGVLILLSVVTLVAVLWRNIDRVDPQQLVEALPDGVELALDDLHYTHNEDGQRLWTLDAENAEYLKEGQRVLLQQVKLHYYRNNSFGEVELTADRGVFDQTVNSLDVEGNVIVTAARGEQLFTERLHYDDKARLLTTEEPVRMLSEQMELSGRGMIVDLDQGRMQVLHDVRSVLRPQNKGE